MTSLFCPASSGPACRQRSVGSAPRDLPLQLYQFAPQPIPKQGDDKELQKMTSLLSERDNRAEVMAVLEDWDEERTPFRPLLYLRASSFTADPLFDLPPAQPGPTCDSYLVSPKGRFGYLNRVLPVGHALSLHRPRHGLVTFDAPVAIPSLVDMGIEKQTQLPFPLSTPASRRAAKGMVWMSLTPMEMLTQRSGVQAAEGTVLVGGLGLGWFLRKVCEKEAVERVILVEKSQELLDWYGYDLCARLPKITEVICDDVWTQVGKHGKAKYLLDIWPDYHGAAHDPHYRKAKRRLGSRLWAWGIN